jgi:hypothetical protein
MKTALIETVISGGSIRIRYANDADPTKATEWIDFRIPLSELKSRREETIGAEAHLYNLAEVHLAALRYVRDAADEEMTRYASLVAR